MDPQFVNILINGTRAYGIRHGAAVATMSNKDKMTKFPTVAVEEPSQEFRVVGGALTKPSVVMRDLEIKFYGVKAKGESCIVEVETPLLDRSWLKKLGLWP